MLKITEENTKHLALVLDAYMYDTNTVRSSRGSPAGRKLARALLMLSDMDRDTVLNSLELQRGR